MGIKDGICPKCGNNLIYANKVQRYKGLWHGNVIHVKGFFLSRFAYLRHYVCASCSYIESYIADGDSMKHILEAFEPLNKEKRKNDKS